MNETCIRDVKIPENGSDYAGLTQHRFEEGANLDYDFPSSIDRNRFVTKIKLRPWR